MEIQSLFSPSANQPANRTDVPGRWQNKTRKGEEEKTQKTHYFVSYSTAAVGATHDMQQEPLLPIHYSSK